MRPAAALLPLAACVLLLTGCGGGGTLGAVADAPAGGDSSPAAVAPATVLRHSVAKLGRYHSVQLLMSQTDPDGNAALSTGVVGWNPETVDLTLTGVRTGRIRYVGGVEYLDQGKPSGLGAKGRAALAGRSWLKVDQNSTDGKQFTASFEGMRPDGLVSLLAGSPLVTEVGSESVNGALATHYTGTVHVAQLAKTATGALAAFLNGQLAQDTYFLKLDVWIGSNGMPLLVRDRQKDSTQTLVQSDTTLTYTQYGTTAASVSAPASAQVYTADELDRARRLDG